MLHVPALSFRLFNEKRASKHEIKTKVSHKQMIPNIPYKPQKSYLAISNGKTKVNRFKGLSLLTKIRLHA